MTDKKKSIGKHELIDKLAESDKLKGISKKTLAAMLDVLMPTIIETVKHDQEVRLVGFGTFKKKHRSSRRGYNPNTNEMVQLSEVNLLGFSSNVRY